MQGGCDKGFCLNYGKLSYRRKFLRTVWMTVFGLSVAACVLTTRPASRTSLTFTLLAILTLIALAQAGYNYQRWQAGTRR